MALAAVGALRMAGPDFGDGGRAGVAGEAVPPRLQVVRNRRREAIRHLRGQMRPGFDTALEHGLDIRSRFSAGPVAHATPAVGVWAHCSDRHYGVAPDVTLQAGGRAGMRHHRHIRGKPFRVPTLFVAGSAGSRSELFRRQLVRYAGRRAGVCPEITKRLQGTRMRFPLPPALERDGRRAGPGAEYQGFGRNRV